MNFKRFLYIAALLLLPGLVRAESQSIGGQFKGLHNSDASFLIDNDEASDLSNVDITDSGFGVKKRAGYTQFKTIGTSTWGVRGGYYFRDIAGADTVIHANNKSVFKSVNGAAYSAVYSTGTSGAYYDFTDSQGYLYWLDSSNDFLQRWDGTTLTSYSTAPQGTQVEATATRLVIAGSTANPNCLDYSTVADFTNFASGALDSSAFRECVGLPGQKINAIRYFNDGLLTWTRNTMSYVTAQTQYDLNPTISLSNTIGSDQPFSVVQDLGVVYFQGTDKRFYSFDGNGVTWLSRKLDTSNLSGNVIKSWAMTSQADFAAGTAGTGLDTAYSPGDVLFATATLIDDFSDGTFTASPAWTRFGPSASTPTVSGGGVVISRGPTGTSDTGIYTANTGPNNGFWTYTFNHSGTSKNQVFKLCTNAPTFAGPNAADNCYAFKQSGDTFSIQRNGSSLATGTLVTTNGTTYTAEIQKTASGALAFLVNNASVVSTTDVTYTSIAYISIGIDGSDKTLTVDNFYFSYPTAQYTSPAFNVGTAITAWSTFDANNVLNSGTLNYAFYVHTGSNISASVFTASQTVTAGQIPTVGVNAYALWTATFTRTQSSYAPALNDVTVNWYEPSTSDIRTFGSVDKNHRILWSVPEGTSTVTNSVTYIYDPRFDSWLKYSAPLDAAVNVGGILYFGGVSTGVVYSYPSGNTDNGAAISAYWKSKSFIGSDPYLEKAITSVGLLAKAQSGSSLSLNCYLNGSATAAKTYTVSLTEASGNPFIRFNDYFSSGKFGTFFSMKFGNTTGDSPFEVYGLRFDYTSKSWRVLP